MTYNINYTFINVEVSGLDSIFRYESHKFITSPMVPGTEGNRSTEPRTITMMELQYEHKINYV